MKLLGVITILCCSVFVGRKLASRYTLRQQTYSALIAFCTEYRTNLTYEKKSMAQLVKDNGDVLFNDLYQRTEQCKRPPDYLTKEEYRYIREFFSKLGRGDSQAALQQSEFYLAHFTACHTNAFQENKQKSALMKKLGVFGGLLVSILIL